MMPADRTEHGEFGCELAETACPDYKPKPCNCAQSRIQEGPDA